MVPPTPRGRGTMTVNGLRGYPGGSSGAESCHQKPPTSGDQPDVPGRHRRKAESPTVSSRVALQPSPSQSSSPGLVARRDATSFQEVAEVLFFDPDPPSSADDWQS